MYKTLGVMLLLTVTAIAGCSQNRGQPDYDTVKRCSDESGFTDRAKADPSNNHANAEELAFINNCVARAQGKPPPAMAASTPLPTVKPSKKRTARYRQSRPARATSGACPKYAPPLYGGVSYCIGN